MVPQARSDAYMRVYRTARDAAFRTWWF